MGLATKIRLWWWDNFSFPLWYRFGSKESHDEITEALKKRREEGGDLGRHGMEKQNQMVSEDSFSAFT